MIRNKWIRLVVLVPIVFTMFCGILVGILYIKQDAIVQRLLTAMNENYAGRIEIKDSHVSIFQNFPYISIDLEHIKIYENKVNKSTPVVEVKDAYIGFDLWTIISGQWEIKKIKLSKGNID
ncbi:MAG: hypothetical protein N2167_08040, partial [Flavobacteriales bacterium]|nr:hypothetical protein [Flavobacteriales bacterium]